MPSCRGLEWGSVLTAKAFFGSVAAGTASSGAEEVSTIAGIPMGLHMGIMLVSAPNSVQSLPSGAEWQ